MGGMGLGIAKGFDQAADAIAGRLQERRAERKDQSADLVKQAELIATNMKKLDPNSKEYADSQASFQDTFHKLAAANQGDASRLYQHISHWFHPKQEQKEPAYPKNLPTPEQVYAAAPETQAPKPPAPTAEPKWEEYGNKFQSPADNKWYQRWFRWKDSKPEWQMIEVPEGGAGEKASAEPKPLQLTGELRTREDAQKIIDAPAGQYSQGQIDQARAYLKELEAKENRIEALKTSTAKTEDVKTEKDAKDIADGVMRGTVPPDLSTVGAMGKGKGMVTAELARHGYDQARATTEWKAVQRFMSTANSTQQLRMRQAIDKINPHADMIENLYSQLTKKGLPTGYKLWNRAALVAAKNLPGETGALAINLEAQINDLSAELGNVYMGGNTPTDQALQMAGKNLSSDWNPETFHMALDLLRKNVTMRQNAINLTGPAGIQGGSPYLPQQQTGGATQASGSPTSYKMTATGPNGHKIGSNDGVSWFDVKTGEAIK